MNILNNNNATAAVILMIDNMLSSTFVGGSPSSHLSSLSSWSTASASSILGMLPSPFFQYLLRYLFLPLLLLWATRKAYVFISSATANRDNGLGDDDRVAEIVADLNAEKEELRKVAASLGRELSSKKEELATLKRRLEEMTKAGAGNANDGANGGVYVFNAGVAPRSEGSGATADLPGCIAPRSSVVKFDANYFGDDVECDTIDNDATGSVTPRLLAGDDAADGRTPRRRSSSASSFKRRSSSRMSTSVEQGEWDFAV
mmetsp:Transcript_34003/g.74793  ORF Transcript_34003/g.74793 Transcript_34003/m.74793 type:complete len:259 (+) Transcript_34003:410-1186(+)